jgi:hypothetical protein
LVGAVNEPLLDQRLAELEKARAWSPRLISKLESHIRSADDLALYRINAFSFAKERGLAENEIIDLFLHATALGLFSMDWSLYCPQCCCVVESFRSLKSLHNHYHCAFCQVDLRRRSMNISRSVSPSAPTFARSRFTTPNNCRPGTGFSRRRTRPRACCPMASRWWTSRRRRRVP